MRPPEINNRLSIQTTNEFAAKFNMANLKLISKEIKAKLMVNSNNIGTIFGLAMPFERPKDNDEAPLLRPRIYF
jgi:hypothetical protein